MAKVGTSNQDRTISLKRLQCVVESNNKYTACRRLVVSLSEGNHMKTQISVVLNNRRVERRCGFDVLFVFHKF